MSHAVIPVVLPEQVPVPWPALTTAQWMTLPLRLVPVTSLVATNNHISFSGLQQRALGGLDHAGFRYACLLRHGERYYIKNGHHYVVWRWLLGATEILGHVA